MSYARQLPLQSSLNRLAVKRVEEAIDRLGMALPCRVESVSGSIVKVSFQVQGLSLPSVTIPKSEDPYFRRPTQVGDTGVTQPADVYLGGISGLGGGIAQAVRENNLTSLIFVPVSNKNSPPPSGFENYAVAQGPDGVLIQDMSGATQIIASKTNGITLTAGGHTITINSSGITLDGIVWGTHTHPYIPGTGSQTETGSPQ